MTTWDMDTVHKVARLGVTLHVGGAELVAHGRAEVAEFTRRRAASQIIDAARVWAVEVHEDDVSAVESQGEFGGVVLDMHWRPFWRNVGAEVELRGGPADGETMTIRRDQLHHGIQVARPMPSLNLADVDQIGPLETLLSGTLLYQLTGWREAERRWVLACDG